MPNNNFTPDIISVYDDITTPSTQGQDRRREPESNKSSANAQQRQPQVTSPAAQPKIDAREKESSKLKTFFSNRGWKITTGIILFLVAFFLCASTVSYFISGDRDQSELDGTSLEQLVQTSGQDIQNIGGPAGALISHRLVTLGLGLGVVPVFVYLILLALALLGLREVKFWSLTFKTLLLAVTISMVLGLIFFATDTVIPPGGYHGYFINRLIIERFSWLGAACVSIALVGCLVGVYFNDLVKFTHRLREAQRRRNEERRRREQERRHMAQQASEKLGDMQPEVNGNNEPAVTTLSTVDDAIPKDTDQQTERAGVPENQGLAKLFEQSDSDTAATQHLQPDSSNQTENNLPESEADNPATLPNELEKPEPVEDNQHDNASGTTETQHDEPEDSEPSAVKEPNFEVQETEEIEKSHTKRAKIFDPIQTLSSFKMPSVELLENRPYSVNSVDVEEIEEKKNQIIDALARFGIGISDIKATVGPTVTMYEIVPEVGVKIATIKRLEEDIAMALAALSTRIIAPIPGKSAIGIEVPNREPQAVAVRTIFESKAFQETDFDLPIALGATIENDVYIADLAKMPHLLVAGATGKGKSVGMNVIINSLLYKKHPSQLKLVLIDPKMVEFYPYRKIANHYLAQVPDAEQAIITDTSKVFDTLNSLCVEMDDRYKLLQQAEVVDIKTYNKKFTQGLLDEEEGHHFMPYIVVIVDEYADLVMTAGNDIETPIARLAQKARAVGMHVIIATQRPSANIITGLIKGNFPARIAFKVSSQVDSKIILDSSGANQLIGKGDMLISHDSELRRIQCAFISTEEIIGVANYIENQPGYIEPFYLPAPPPSTDKKGARNTGTPGSLGDEDPLLEEVARAIVLSGQASTSNVQRNYSIGYNRAGRIMDQLHILGIVGPAQGSKPRDILVDTYRLEEILQNRHE